MVGVLVAETEGDMRDRVREQIAVLGQQRQDAEEWLARATRPLDHGHARPARQRIEEFAAAGVQRIMLQDFLPRDLEMVALLGRIAARLTAPEVGRAPLALHSANDSLAATSAGTGDRDEHLTRAA